MIHACNVDDVPMGEGRAITLAGRRIALFRATTGWYALDHACPHLGGPLADGIVSDCSVICPLHARRFELATGRALSGGEDVAVHAVEIHGDRVMVRVGEPPVFAGRDAA